MSCQRNNIDLIGVVAWVAIVALCCMFWAFVILGILSLTGCQPGYAGDYYDPIKDEIYRVEQDERKVWL